jgi:uncharacterized phage-associated protein
MMFRFNDRKTAQAAAHLLRLRGGTMSHMKLIKLLYLADRSMLLSQGQPITGDRMVSMKNGPVLSRVLDLVNCAPNVGSSWSEYIGPRAGNEVSLKMPEPGTDELSNYELRILDSIFAEFGGKTRWEMVDVVHALPEWKNPGRSVFPIEHEDILRAGSVPQQEIDRIEKDAKELWVLDTICQ